MPWMDAAIVVVFEDRFEFVAEDHPDPMGRLKALQAEGGLAIGLAGMMPKTRPNETVFLARLFKDFKDQAWAHRYMEILRGIVRGHSSSN